MSNRGQHTNYSGGDTSISISQQQGASHAQLTVTNDRLKGEWSPRAIVERRYTKRQNQPARTFFLPISPRGPLYGLHQQHGDSFVIGYGLVRPKVNTVSTRDKQDVFDQFATKDDAYLWEKQSPTYIPPDKLTPRFVIEGYGYNHRQPTQSTWGGKYYVMSTTEMLSAPSGFRVVAVAEVPPGTAFEYPFGSLDRLKEDLDDRAIDYTIDPHFRRVA